MKLIGPFTQIITMNNLPVKGSVSDDKLQIIKNGGIIINHEKIVEVGPFLQLKKKIDLTSGSIQAIEGKHIAMPGFIDAHTHICWAGSRINDYALRLSGKTYIEIAQQGGGIWNTVKNTRKTGISTLEETTAHHANELLHNGITSIEVKSGYGLTKNNELKMLRAIRNANTQARIVPTCLAAHICPHDFKGTSEDYLNLIISELLPAIKYEKLSNRVDIFVDQAAFSINEARVFLNKAHKLGFDIIIHGDQFSTGGGMLAAEIGATSVDHLEISDSATIHALARSNTVAVALPGATIGLGLPFAPARQLLDAGASLAIASDWNPGSAPMGNLLAQASILGAYQKLTIAETLAAITFRAAKALKLNDCGILKKDYLADIVAFESIDYREVIYRQGMLRPSHVWKSGELIEKSNIQNKNIVNP